MKTLKPLATLTLCLLSAFGTSVVLSPQKAKAQTECSNRTLYGTYRVEGATRTNMFNGSPISIEGLEIDFDGNGKIKGTIWYEYFIGYRIRTGRGPGVADTYQVNSDCSFTATYTSYNQPVGPFSGNSYNDGLAGHYSGFVTSDGKSFVFSKTDPGSNYFSAKGQRINTDSGTPEK